MKYITQTPNQGPFFDYCFDKNRLKKWISKIYDETIATEDITIIKFIEDLKTFGFNEATKAGISIGIDDLKIPPQKRELLKSVESETQLANERLQNETITPLENFQLTIDLWHKTNETIKGEVVTNFESTDTLNPVYMMAFSGARGNLSQVTQLLGMRGFMSDPEGQIIDFPIRSNFREGLTLTEYIISCYGARKGLVDTALRTADAGYLTRRLVDVAHSLVITIHDCKPKNPTWLAAIKENNKIIYPLETRLVGRVLADDISINYFDPETKTTVKEFWPYFKKYKQINQLDAKLLGSCFKFIKVRSPLSCNQIYSLCQLCYGWTLPHSHLAPLGEAVGIIAAQSIGEPGTQLTMRTFHTGGVFSGVLSDEILAPYAGIIEYDRPVIGAMFRLSNGKLGFLTRGTAKIRIQPFQKNGFNQPIFEMDLPEDSILFLKHSEKVKENQLLLELPKEKDDDNETLLNEYTYYSKTSGLIKLEEANVQPQLNYYPDKLYKHRRFKRRPRRVLRGTKQALTLDQAYTVRKKKTIYVYYPMQEQNQKYNSVKIYHGEICYASAFETLPKPGDLVNRNSLIGITELNQVIESKLSKGKQQQNTKINKLLQNNSKIPPPLKLEKTLFNFNFKNVYYKCNSGYITSNKKQNAISVTIQSLKGHSQKSSLKINLIPNNFVTKTNGTILFCPNSKDHNVGLTSLNHFTNGEKNSNLIFWLSEPIIKDWSGFTKLKSPKSLNIQNQKNSGNYLVSKQKTLTSNDYQQNRTLMQRDKFNWVKKGNIFSIQKNTQGLVKKSHAETDGLIQRQIKKISLIPTNKNKKRIRYHFVLKKIKTGWPYLGLSFSSQCKVSNQQIKLIGENVLHDIYNDQHNLVCEYYSTKSIKFNLDGSCLKKLQAKKTLVNKMQPKTLNFINQLQTQQSSYLVLLRPTHQFNLATLNEQTKECQSNWLKNDSLQLLKKYQYLKPSKFAKIKSVFFNDLFNQLNRQSILLSKILQIEAWISRFEQNIFVRNHLNVNQKSHLTNHQFITHRQLISPKILAYLTITIRPNSFFSNTQEFFQSNNVFAQRYESGMFSLINTDPFFIKQLNGTNQTYCALTNLPIQQHLPVIKNFFLSNHNGEIFNDCLSKYADLHREFQLKEKLKLKSSPGSTILTSGNSFTIRSNHKERKWHIGKEVYRGLDLGNKTTPLTSGQIIYLTKNHIKCQRIDKFIMSTNSKFFCQNNQLILKNTRLYTDFYPRLQMGDIVQGIPKIEEFFEARRSKKGLPFEGNLHNRLKERFNFYRQIYPLPIADRRSINDIQTYIIGSIFKLYSSQGINISDKHLELIVRQMTAKVHITEYYYGALRFEFSVMQLQPISNEYYPRYIVEDIYWNLLKQRRTGRVPVFRYFFQYEPIIFGITQASLDSFGFISAASFQETTRILTRSSILQKTDYLKGLKENVVLGHLIPAGTALQTRLKHGPRKVMFKRTQFKTKLSRLLINRCVVESKLKYSSSSNSCHYSYKKSHKFVNPILYLFLYVYCVYYSYPRVV